MKYGFTKPEYESFPPIVHVETTNACNLRCIHCPHQDVKNIIPGYQAEFMKFETWQRVVDEVSQHPVALRITPAGEPMWLNPFADRWGDCLKVRRH